MNADLTSYWSLHEDEVLRSVESSPNGLTEAESKHRQSINASFELESRKRSSILILFDQFNNPIILLLFVSAVLSYFLGDTTNAFTIGLILVLSGLLGFWQERSASDAVAKLLEVVESKTSVLRDGVEVVIPLTKVVPGDVVLFRAGTVVPGDCRILGSHELHVNEAALTGESFPSEKSASTIEAAVVPSKRTNCLFLGTHIVSGTAQAVVVRVGRQTEFGNISTRLEKRAPSTGFERGLRAFGKLILAITGVLVVVVFLANIYFQRPIVESFLFALALAVGMTPQLLPAITSVVLATGAKTMAKSDVIVKRLLAIENFGGMDVLCLDKTGTLTEGSVELHSACDIYGEPSQRVLRLAAINSHFESGFENPIDTAIRRFTTEILADVRKLGELPYDFTRRKLSVLVSESQRQWLITKGAVADVLSDCKFAELPNQEMVPIETVRDAVLSQFASWSDEGYRVLAVAYRETNLKSLQRADESEMTFAGFLMFSDPLKPAIGETLKQLNGLGIRLKLITGDNRNIACTIGTRVGLNASHVLTGGEIRGLDLEQLRNISLETDIFAEIEPEQKERIVLALKSSKHIVGFLGDGINDAPALHAADVGISVASAVDVAKEAAQVVLLKRDLNVLAQGVVEGRRTLANTLKYIFVSISANFGYMLSMAIASLFLPFLPLLPTQILLINLLADFPAMALATDSVDPETLERPCQWNIRSILRFMLMFGLIGTCSDLLTFVVLLQIFQTSQEEFRTGWFIVSIITGLLILLAVRTKRAFFRSRPGGWLMIAASSITIVTLILPYTNVGRIFELVPPSPWLLVFVAIVGLLYTLTMEFAKRIYYRNEVRFEEELQT